MTTLRNSQLGTISISGPPVAAGVRSSQMGAIAVTENPPAASLNASQLFVVIVAANGKNYLSLGPVIPLPCWQPCTAYGTRAVVIRFN